VLPFSRFGANQAFPEIGSAQPFLSPGKRASLWDTPPVPPEKGGKAPEILAALLVVASYNLVGF